MNNFASLFNKLPIALSAVSVLLVGLFLPTAASAQGAHCTINGEEGVKVTFPVDGQTCIPVGSGLESNVIFKFLVVFIQFLAVGVGLAVVGGIIYGGFLYITARANAAQTEKGRNTIINSVVGLLMFIFMYAILEFLIPGNIFG